MITKWLYNEFQQTGKDYTLQKEVDVYDPSHDDFRNLAKEIQEVIEWLRPNKRLRFLDIGCGTGNFSLALAAHSEKVYAIDVSETMLKAAKAKADIKQIKNISFSHTGYLNFNLPEKSIDGVISSLSLHHLPDYWKSIALEKIFHILKPGGRFYFYDVVIPDHNSIDKINAFIKSQELKGGDFMREDTIIHFKEEYSTLDWIMKTLLTNAGFVVIREEIQDGVLKKFFCEKT
ncbi:class I SAM-dependent methyltransferase [uncultured Cyclobacterium sp.]|uniref:class I SAM-dependent methyltransferase n=1 Tax=uncultured Cyclobacterium sp. TaxID=453820 RepID=UPI0030EBFAB0|tara:strand:- start:846 stop:1541 length:696 start_codon:yes stop_codon:yes gene_type:complete